MANTKITKPRRAARGSPLRVTRRTPGSQLIQLTQDEYSELLSMVKSSNNRLELLDQNRLSAVGTPLKSADSAPETTNLDVSDRPSTSSELGTDASAYPYADDSNSQSSRAGDEAAEMAFYSIEKGLGYYYGRDIRDMVSFCIGQSIDLLACDIRSVAQTYAQTLDWDDDISDDVRAKFLDWSPYTREYIRCPRRVVFVFEAWIWHTLVDALFSKANFYKRNRGSRHAYEVLRENVLTEIESKETFSYRKWNKLVLRACQSRALLTAQADRASKLLKSELGDYVDLLSNMWSSAACDEVSVPEKHAARRWRRAIEGLGMQAAVVQTLMQLDVAEWHFQFADPKTGMEWGFEVDEGRMVSTDFAGPDGWGDKQWMDASAEESVELVGAPLIRVRETTGEEPAVLLPMMVGVGYGFRHEGEGEDEVHGLQRDDMREASGNEDAESGYQASTIRGVKRKWSMGEDESEGGERGQGLSGDHGEGERNSSRRCRQVRFSLPR